MIFIVCGIYVKPIANGQNIQSRMMAIEANSGEEAVGKFIIDSNALFTEHHLFQIPLWMSIEEAEKQV